MSSGWDSSDVCLASPDSSATWATEPTIEAYGSEAEHRDPASNDEHKEEDGAAAMDVDDARAEAALRREIAAVRAEREAVDAEIAKLRAAEP